MEIRKFGPDTEGLILSMNDNFAALINTGAGWWFAWPRRGEGTAMRPVPNSKNANPSNVEKWAQEFMMIEGID